jgi:hypothetical protein
VAPVIVTALTSSVESSTSETALSISPTQSPLPDFNASSTLRASSSEQILSAWRRWPKD